MFFPSFFHSSVNNFLSYSSENTFLDWHNVHCDVMGCNLIHAAEGISGARFSPPTGLSVNTEIKAASRTKYTNVHFYIAKTNFLN